MNIKKIYEIQVNHLITVANGHTQNNSKNADNTIVKLGYLAAVVGWSHEVDVDADSDSEIFKVIENFAPTHDEYRNLLATYEIAGLIASNNVAVKMEW